jgi:prepilin-type processing-associated H-X9-DG protein
MTLVEVFMVTAVVVLVAAIFIPAVAKSHGTRCRIHCINNLKQIGIAMRMFANDHGDAFPWAVVTNNGGSKEFGSSSQVFQHFLVASNELNTPKILTCPDEPKQVGVSDWNLLRNQNISYFVGLTADEATSESLLSGDKGISGGVLSNSFIALFSTSRVSWAASPHKGVGNIAFGDGSAQQLTAKQLEVILATNRNPSRLAIP